MTHIIAVTACPSGVAHTYMAAESLESAAKAKGWQVKVETQGSIGIENELTADESPRRYGDSDQRYRHQM
jgi:fructose-specific PTS system IIB-like component